MIKIIIVILIFLFATPSIYSNGSKVDYDTTRVRIVEPIKKSLGKKIIDIPGEILKTPIYLFEYSAKTISLNFPMSNLFSLIKIEGDAGPFLPIIGYGSRSGLKLGFGLKLLNQKNPRHYIKLKWYYSTNAYQSYQFKWHHSELFSQKIGFNFYFRHKKRTRQNFYGIGMMSRKENEVNYTLEDSEFKASIPIQLRKKIKLNILSDYQISNIFNGRDPNLEGDLQVISNDSSLGLETGQLQAIRHLDFGLSFELDRRNSLARPSSGNHLIAHYERMIGLGRSEGNNYNSYSIDFRNYLNIWRGRVLAFRTYLKRVDADDSKRQSIPFYLISQLGGVNMLRGYLSGRFADNDLTLVSVEYRYPIYSSIDAFLFLDVGRVYDDIAEEAFFHDWRHSYGFGLRIWDDENVLAIIQIARSEEATRFYFELGTTW